MGGNIEQVMKDVVWILYDGLLFYSPCLLEWLE